MDREALTKLVLLVGRIDGKLDAHIASVDRDREAAVLAAQDSAEYRKEVRHKLANLEMKVSAVPPLAERVEAVEGATETQKAFRLKVAGAIFVLSLLWSAVGFGISLLAPSIKAHLMTIFGVG